MDGVRTIWGTKFERPLGAALLGVRILLRMRRKVPLPHPRLFCAKSAESLEKKRVEFSESAKKRKRVRKKQKGKEIGEVDEIKERHPTRRGKLPGRVNR